MELAVKRDALREEYRRLVGSGVAELKDVETLKRRLDRLEELGDLEVKCEWSIDAMKCFKPEIGKGKWKRAAEANEEEG